MRAPLAMEMGEQRSRLVLGVLHGFNLAAAAACWKCAPGGQVGARTAVLAAVAFLGWVSVAIAFRRTLTPLTAALVVGTGTLLPFVWIAAFLVCGVSLAFAVTTGVFGVFFVALWPLALWGAFVTIHFGSRWAMDRLVGRTIVRGSERRITTRCTCRGPRWLA